MTKLDWIGVGLICSGWLIVGLLYGCLTDNPLTPAFRL